MKRVTLITTIGIIILLPLATIAGDLEPTEAPPKVGSRMPTLQELYDYLKTGEMWTDRVNFEEPAAGPAPTMKTLKEIYDGIKALFELCQASPDQVLDTATFFNTDPANWGPGPGNIPIQTVNSGAVNQPTGYYESFDLSTVDPDLVAENIRSGVTIFGLGGSVLEASGDANDADVLTGKTYSNDSGNSTGTMPNVGQQNILPGTTDVAIQSGYHDGTGIVAGDDDLVAGNVQNGVEIFGVTGTALFASGTANATQVLEGATFSNSSEVNIPGTMPDRGSMIITPDTSPQVIEEGYHNGSGYVEGDPDLLATNIRQGVSIFDVEGNTRLSIGNAAAADVLDGRTFSNTANVNILGTMPNRGAVLLTPTTTDQQIEEGYHNGSGYVEGDLDLVVDNIRNGVEIFGVIGTLGGNAVDAQVLEGQTYCNDSGNSTGTMPNRGSVIIMPAATPQPIEEGYHNGLGYVEGEPNLVPENIAENVTIFGVTGTYTGGSTSPYPVPLPVTGQTKCYDVSGDEIGCSGTGQDGDLQKGVAWPDPRFTDNNDGTVSDNLTGLIWASRICGAMSWDSALTFVNSVQDGVCGLSDGSSAGDWRLPNIHELFSILDFSRSSYIGGSFGIPEGVLWSSTTDPHSRSEALGIQLQTTWDGPILTASKTTRWYLFPVREGQ